MTARGAHRDGSFTRRNLLGMGVTAASVAALGGCSFLPGGEYKPGSARLKDPLGKEIPGLNYPDPFNSPRIREITAFGDAKDNFTVMFSGGDDDISGDPTAEWLSTRTGVSVTFQHHRDDTFVEEMQRILGFEEQQPDAIVAAISPRLIAELGGQGQILALDQLVDQHAPELLELFKAIPTLRLDITAPDGKMYFFPRLDDRYRYRISSIETLINRVSLDKLGLKPPTTTTELRDLLTAFKTENPAGVANAVPMIDTRSNLLNFLLAAFTYQGASSIAADNGKAVWTVRDPGYREGLSYVAGLLRDGLCHRDTFRIAYSPEQDALAKAEHPPVGVMGRPLNDVSDDFESLPPISAPNTKAQISWQDGPYVSAAMILPKHTRDATIMTRWADALLGGLGTLGVVCGPPQGESARPSFSWSGSGATGADGRQALYESGPIHRTRAADRLFGAAPAALTHDLDTADSVEPSSSLVTTYRRVKAYEEFRVSPDRIFKYRGEALTQEQNDLGSRLYDVISAAEQKFVTGAANPDDDTAWNAFQTSVTEAGADDYLALLNR